MGILFIYFFFFFFFTHWLNKIKTENFAFWSVFLISLHLISYIQSRIPSSPKNSICWCLSCEKSFVYLFPLSKHHLVFLLSWNPKKLSVFLSLSSSKYKAWPTQLSLSQQKNLTGKTTLTLFIYFIYLFKGESASFSSSHRLDSSSASCSLIFFPSL